VCQLKIDIKNRHTRKKSGCCVALHPQSLRRTTSKPHFFGLPASRCLKTGGLACELSTSVSEKYALSDSIKNSVV
jgi:hypothetical protein